MTSVGPGAGVGVEVEVSGGTLSVEVAAGKAGADAWPELLQRRYR